MRLDGEIDYDQSTDSTRALLFPLHLTAYCLCDALKCENYFDSDQVIILSASSKTAIGLAQGLSEENISPKVLGLTSSGNFQFVEKLGCYDEVLSYDQIENKTYPNVLVTSGFFDSQVQYWEPLKYVAKLRDHWQGDNKLYIYMNMDAGHGGKSGRFRIYKEVALEYAFLLDLADKKVKPS